ncbi:hypothetical protein GCM10008938_26860 [Deinococcus roseus]|uniref:NadR/Ttd14 AAA domain-containing protein n=1 Tax=Deinococcus roseus TaxID=392414 RepID=A0ABQ2D2V2_9DEIO|nr:hypothetical protein GCM10008938_26860 [Deinococcus roseus]
MLITGASCVGKTTVRQLLQDVLKPQVEAVELTTLTPYPRDITLTWRHQAIETVVQHALKLQQEGKHLLLAGDPVPPGELLAVPSAEHLEGIRVLLLDVQEEAHLQRLERRQDDPRFWPNHLAVAAWFRAHVRDPQHLQAVILQGAWEAMHWERWEHWTKGHPAWQFDVLDTSHLNAEQVAAQALLWCRKQLG